MENADEKSLFNLYPISSKDSYLFVYGYQKVGYGLINSVHGATGIVTTVYAYFVGVFLSLFVLTSVGQAF